jgi:hypothetical protein
MHGTSWHRPRRSQDCQGLASSITDLRFIESRQQAAKGSRSKGGILEHRFLMLATVPGSTAVAAADTLDPVWTLLSYGSFTA